LFSDYFGAGRFRSVMNNSGTDISVKNEIAPLNMTPEEVYAEALRRVREAKNTEATALDLSI
jgi:hypothetical protein